MMGVPGTTPERPSNTGRGTARVIAQIVLLAAIVFIPPRLAGLPALSDVLGSACLILGLVVALLGVLMAVLGSLSLGSSLTIFPRPREDGSLVQNGLYGLVRHPIYSGVLRAALGLSISR